MRRYAVTFRGTWGVRWELVVPAEDSGSATLIALSRLYGNLGLEMGEPSEWWWMGSEEVGTGLALPATGTGVVTRG